MKIALIYPPVCDPTAPYLSVPMLTAYLRKNGVTVLPVDANAEAFDRLLRRPALLDMGKRIARRLARLGKKPTLNHSEQLLWHRLLEAGEDTGWVPEMIEEALSILRDPVRFYEPALYEEAAGTVQAALGILSAAYGPLEMDFAGYRTPFSLLSMAQIRSDAQPDKNPFHDYFAGELTDRLAAASVSAVGVSLAFPGQIQPGYALAHVLRETLPGVHLTVGGPALTQMFLRFDPERRADLLGPFHSAVLREGEEALLNLVRMLAAGRCVPQVTEGESTTVLSGLPPPDFEGIPLQTYLSPEPVLPYDPSRGCYWGKCAFCHYGLAEQGTAGYRERPVATVVAHLEALHRQWGCRIFHFSQDTFAPKTARRLARQLGSLPIRIRWTTDMRPEGGLTPACCRELAEGGALSVALGIESAAARVLALIDKGVSLEAVNETVKNLCAAGIAVEAMCFTGFPTETLEEALETLHWIRASKESLSLFICGRFGLCHGSRVALHPKEYGIDRIWHLEGDQLLSGLFYQERVDPKTEAGQERIEHTVEALSRLWWLHDYPWAGSLSTAHTMLYYAKYGPDVFRRFAKTSRRIFSGRAGKNNGANLGSRFRIQETLDREDRIWNTMIYRHRAVSPGLYRKLAETGKRAKGKGRRRKDR